METYYGKSVSGGIASGKILYMQKRNLFSLHKKTENVDVESDKFHNAVKQLETELDDMSAKLADEGRRTEYELTEAHKLILDAPEFLDNCIKKITEEKLEACCAVYEAGEMLATRFENMADAFMRERSADIRGVVQRLLTVLDKDVEMASQLTEPVIIVADELTPAETMRLDKNKVLGLVINQDSENSHTAVIARLWNIPAVIGVKTNSGWNGQQIIVNGENGIVYLNPTEKTVEMLSAQAAVLQEEENNLKEYIGLHNKTQSGKTIEIYANVGTGEEIQSVLDNDAGGIGLFRTEFLFMGRTDAPAEEEQFEIYKKTVMGMHGKPVIIRTMDIGMDKCVDYISLPKEDNPALGMRGIRVSLAYEELFMTQLRALLRAAAYGDVRIMFPMVTSVTEVRKAKILIDKIKEEFKQQNCRYGDAKVGIMVETPAAAILSDVLAKEVDFFSIGTNDLMQYALAADRKNPALAAYSEECKEAVIRLIGITVENAHNAGIPVGICGDMAADSTMTGEFLEMGIDSLSVPPAKVLEIRACVRAYL